jgi:hypothetical protein
MGLGPQPIGGVASLPDDASSEKNPSTVNWGFGPISGCLGGGPGSLKDKPPSRTVTPSLLADTSQMHPQCACRFVSCVGQRPRVQTFQMKGRMINLKAVKCRGSPVTLGLQPEVLSTHIGARPGGLVPIRVPAAG